jgi:ERCC4-type nuclease
MKGQPTYANTNINININIAPKKEKKEIEEVAKFFASKVPKITNFDNKKSRKYFSSESNNRDSQAITIKDKLIYLKTESSDPPKSNNYKFKFSFRRST